MVCFVCWDGGDVVGVGVSNSKGGRVMIVVVCDDSSGLSGGSFKSHLT